MGKIRRNSICDCGCGRKVKVCRGEKELEAEILEKDRREKFYAELGSVDRPVAKCPSLAAMTIAAFVTGGL